MQRNFYEKPIFIMTALLLLMAVLLIPRLNKEGLWGDEGWSVYFTNGDSLRDTVHQLTEDRHPPLYFLLLDVWRTLASDDEITMRMLAVFAGLITAALVYRLGRDLFGTSAGLFAVLIFAMLDKQVVFSEEVRHYTFFMLWAVASTWALVRWLPHDPPSKWTAFAYVAAITGGLYTHTLMGFVILVHLLFAIFAIPFRRWGRFVLLYVFIGLAFLPWGMVFVYQYQQEGGKLPALPLTWGSIETLTPEMVGRPVAFMLGLIVLGILSPWLKSPGWVRNRPYWKNVFLLVLGIVLPIVVIFVYGDSGDSSLLNDRVLATIVPSMVLLMGLGITAFGKFARVALVLFVLVNGLLTTDADYISPPSRPIARYIAAHQIDDEPVITDVGGEDAALGYHLRQEVGADMRQISIWELARAKRKDPNFDPYGYLLFEELRDVQGLWYIYWSPNSEFLDAMQGWGYRRTGEAKAYHLGSPIYMYRFDLPIETTLTTFGEQIVLHQTYAPQEIQTGDKLTVSLWWSAPEHVIASYNVSVFLLNQAGQLVAQHDGYPQDGQRPTYTWDANELIYDAHILATEGLPTGDYQIGVKLYNPLDGSILRTNEGSEYFIVGSLLVK